MILQKKILYHFQNSVSPFGEFSHVEIAENFSKADDAQSLPKICNTEWQGMFGRSFSRKQLFCSLADSWGGAQTVGA